MTVTPAASQRSASVAPLPRAHQTPDQACPPRPRLAPAGRGRGPPAPQSHGKWSRPTTPRRPPAAAGAASRELRRLTSRIGRHAYRRNACPTAATAPVEAVTPQTGHLQLDVVGVSCLEHIHPQRHRDGLLAPIPVDERDRNGLPTPRARLGPRPARSRYTAHPKAIRLTNPPRCARLTWASLRKGRVYHSFAPGHGNRGGASGAPSLYARRCIPYPPTDLIFNAGQPGSRREAVPRRGLPSRRPAPRDCQRLGKRPRAPQHGFQAMRGSTE